MSMPQLMIAYLILLGASIGFQHKKIRIVAASFWYSIDYEKFPNLEM